jgi:hypothetical protein
LSDVTMISNSMKSAPITAAVENDNSVFSCEHTQTTSHSHVEVGVKLTLPPVRMLCERLARAGRDMQASRSDTRGASQASVRTHTRKRIGGADSTKLPKLEWVQAFTGLVVLPRVSHSALAGSRRLRSTLVAAPPSSTHAVVAVA